ncbi:TonB-dependent receptor domain-containing protein [Sporomusa aerivorans]|uniref:TonB-dependent receptor domain-containing protein n=1 Tax=Sporomusa aerivorans TaxID=204936 RepID=UPI00352BCEC9
MNHIYKIIWNRARACWQVVSELAKSTGRMKSVRCSSGVRGAKCIVLSLVWLLALNIAALFIHTAAAFTPPADTKNTWTYIGLVDGYDTWTSTSAVGGNGHLAGTSKKYLTAITLNAGERWRPLDMRTPATNALVVYATVSDLTLNAGSMLDLAGRQALLYLPTSQFPGGFDNTQKQIAGYHFTIDKLTLAGDAVFRINTNIKLIGGNGGFTGASITVKQLEGAGGTVYIQSAYDPAWKELVRGVGSIYERKTLALSAPGNYDNYIAADFSAADYSKVNVVGQASLMDGPLRLYELVPVIDWNNLHAGKAVLVALKAYNTGVISESGKMASDAQLTYRNIWRIEEGNLFTRMDELHARHYGNTDAPSLAGAADRPVSEGVWAHSFRGKLNSRGAYGRSVSQSYNGLQAGFDKAREGDFYNGTLYYGLMLGQLDAGTGYATGRGDLTGTSMGTYASWIGHNGRYLDLAARMTKIENDYRFHDSDSVNTAKYGSWASGISARYGYRRDLPDGWYYEPQAGLAVGNLDRVSYTLPNQLTVSQTADRPVVGRLGVTVGKTFGDEAHRGHAYANITALHDFGSGKLEARFSGDRATLRTGADQDTWLEFKLGAALQTARDSTAFLEVSKSTGGDVRQDWQINGGLSWKWGLPAKAGKAEGSRQSTVPAVTATAPVAGDGNSQRIDSPPPSAHIAPQLPAAGGAVAASSDQPSGSPVAALDAIALPPAAPVDEALPDTGRPPVRPVAINPGSDSSELATYAFEAVTVEAPRPEWERDLSPGTVSVIRPEDFQGEQKTLPDYLETVPGVHIQRVRGTSNYSIARVRGSTAAQVGVYLDGVELNLTSETGVDLSAIPMDNVARIEVYRGYVPARFAGAPMGGVINIVTKKPGQSGGSVSAGLRSFGGYKGNLEVTAPLGEGSLLLAANRDQSDGDFSYTNRYHPTTPYGIGPLTAERRTRRNNDYHLTDGLLKWQDDHWQVKLAVKDQFRHFPGYAGSESSDNPDYVYPVPEVRLHPPYQEIRQTDLAVGRRQQVGNLDWGWQVDWRDSDKEWRSGKTTIAHQAYYPGQAWSNLRSKRLGGSLDAAWRLGDSHLLELYAGYSRERMDTELSDLDKYLKGGDESTGSGRDTSIAVGKWLKYYQIDRWRLQLQDTMQLNRSGTFQLTPVFKMDKLDMTAYKEDGKDAWKYSFGIGAKKMVNDHWTVRGSWGTFHRFPNFYEIFGDGASLRPTPDQFPPPDFEHGLNWDAGVTWQGRALGSKADVTLTYFANRTNDLMLLNVTPLGVSYYNNGGDGKARGVELESRFKWDRWDLTLAATWTRTKILGYRDVLELIGAPNPQPYRIGSPYPYIPEWEGNARLTYRFPGDRLALFAEHHYSGKMPIDRVDRRGCGEWQEPYGLTNLGARYAVNSRLKLNAGVNDLFNQGPDIVEDYIPSSSDDAGRGKGMSISYPLQGRTYYLTVQYLF